MPLILSNMLIFTYSEISREGDVGGMWNSNGLMMT